MPVSYATVIAWRMLVHHKARLALSLCGIAFSVLVLFMGIGFFNGLNDSEANLAPLLNADLVMISAKRTNLGKSDRMSRVQLYQAQADPEVGEVIAVYEGRTSLTNPQSKMSKSIVFLAFAAGTDPLAVPGMLAHKDKLKVRGTVLYDRLSREVYGKIHEGMQIDLSEGKFTVAGTVAIGPNFSRNGYVLMSDTTWLSGRPAWEADRISYGLIRAVAGTDVNRLAARLAATLPTDVTLLTPAQLHERNVRHTTRATPVGALLGIGLIVGFVIGVIICYQILFNEITDHMPQFATLKAVGFSKPFLMAVVMKEALLLSVVGFLPGLAAGQLLYSVVEHLTQILMFLTPARILVIFVLTIGMCAVAGMLAVKKVLQADPAELF